ncbi:MAG TPA: hypothetical protein PL001_08315, partial [Candidatus Kryptobacter bacterium]|nr:hypothetical protein [Candidatus Kryptobacter bacterium]
MLLKLEKSGMKPAMGIILAGLMSLLACGIAVAQSTSNFQWVQSGGASVGVVTAIVFVPPSSARAPQV